MGCFCWFSFHVLDAAFKTLQGRMQSAFKRCFKTSLRGDLERFSQRLFKAQKGRLKGQADQAEIQGQKVDGLLTAAADKLRKPQQNRQFSRTGQILTFVLLPRIPPIF